VVVLHLLGGNPLDKFDFESIFLVLGVGVIVAKLGIPLQIHNHTRNHSHRIKKSVVSPIRIIHRCQGDPFNSR
jgi:hypothetical protein